MPGQEVGGAAAGAGRCHRAVRIWTFTLTFDYVDKGLLSLRLLRLMEQVAAKIGVQLH